MDGNINVVRKFVELSEDAKNNGLCVCVKDQLHVSPLGEKTEAYEIADIDGEKPESCIFSGNLQQLEHFLSGFKAAKI